ncbi:MAG: Ldh family oxidoreductase [Candidatus Competibacterales bacterium]
MVSEPVRFDELEATAFAVKVLRACGAHHDAALALARGIVAAEGDGIVSHGFNYLPIYCEHLRCGKVRGDAVPSVEAISEVAFVADAGHGFAHLAIERGLEQACAAARRHALAALGVRNSYNCGVLGFHVENIARQGLMGLGFTNAPASIAPVGGTRAVVGTNPFALGVPDGQGGAALVIDQSSSVVAKSEINVRAKKGEPLPEGWAFGPDGTPTTDPHTALQGTMAPAGGYKGVGIALPVELFAAALTGATLGLHASSFAKNDGGPPGTGQFFLLIDPKPFSQEAFGQRLEDLVAAITAQEGARLPGQRRRAARERIAQKGIAIGHDLYQRILGYLQAPPLVSEPRDR